MLDKSPLLFDFIHYTYWTSTAHLPLPPPPVIFNDQMRGLNKQPWETTGKLLSDKNITAMASSRHMCVFLLEGGDGAGTSCE